MPMILEFTAHGFRGLAPARHYRAGQPLFGMPVSPQDGLDGRWPMPDIAIARMRLGRMPGTLGHEAICHMFSFSLGFHCIRGYYYIDAREAAFFLLDIIFNCRAIGTATRGHYHVRPFSEQPAYFLRCHEHQYFGAAHIY